MNRQLNELIIITKYAIKASKERRGEERRGGEGRGEEGRRGKKKREREKVIHNGCNCAATPVPPACGPLLAALSMGAMDKGEASSIGDEKGISRSAHEHKCSIRLSRRSRLEFLEVEVLVQY